MFAEAGVPLQPDGSGIDALVDALWWQADEAAVQQRIRELLASGLDETADRTYTRCNEERGAPAVAAFDRLL